MIYVIATIELEPNSRENYLEILKNNVVHVKAEAGCLQYEPAIDINSGLPLQETVKDNVVVIIEAWESLDHLDDHLKAPHMLAYRDEVANYVKRVSVRIMAPVVSS